MKNYFRLLIFFSLLILVDQLFKSIFRENSVCNKNLAWSIPIASGFFYLLWAIIIFFIIYSLANSKNNSEKIAFIFILSGAISNLADRIFRGCVIDFIDLKFWPVFNLADTYITLGIILLAFGIFKIPLTKHQ